MPTTVTPSGVQATSALGTAVEVALALAAGVQGQSAIGRVGLAATSVTVAPAGVAVLAALGAPTPNPQPPVFLLAPNWSSPVELVSTWRTDVLQGEDGTEQRVSQRAASADRIRFGVSLMDQGEAGTERLILAGGQDGRVLMPRWCDATALTAAVTIGATSIPCDTTDRAFVAGGQVLLWRRQAQLAEVRLINAVSPTAIDITGDAATMAWAFPSDTLVVPVAPARLVLPLARTYVGGVLVDVKVDAEYEVEQPPALGPTASTAVTISIGLDEGASNIFRPGAFIVAHAEVRDADDLEIPEAVVVWSVDDPTICTVQSVGIFGHQAIVRRVDPSLVTSTTLHATSGGASATAIVGP